VSSVSILCLVSHICIVICPRFGGAAAAAAAGGWRQYICLTFLDYVVLHGGGAERTASAFSSLVQFAVFVSSVGDSGLASRLYWVSEPTYVPQWTPHV
jgi:hypothetical protein